MDEYDSSLGVNRRSRRAMEEENKKKRKKARREYNDLVRDLAAFVKKRDKRVRDMQVKKSLEEEKRREEEKKRKDEEARRKMERARMYEEQEWAKIDDDEEGRVFDEMGVDEEDESKGKKKELYCVVCNKKFKSDKQWKNHEQSKKHRDKVAELRVSFREEEEVGFESAGDGEAEKMEDDDNVVDELAEEFKEELGLEEEGVEDEDSEKLDGALGSDDEASMLEAMVSDSKSRKSTHLGLDDFVTNQGDYLNNDEESFTGCNLRKGRRRAVRRGTDENDKGKIFREETSRSGKGEDEVQNQEESSEPNEGEIQIEGENGKETKEPSPSEEAAAKGKGNQTRGKKHKTQQQVDAKGPEKKDAKISKSSSKGKKQKVTIVLLLIITAFVLSHLFSLLWLDS